MRLEFLAACIATVAMSGPARADNAAIGLGTKLTPADLAGMYSVPPDGTGLPPGQGSVAQGAVTYGAKCAGCHGADLQGNKALGAPPLVGGRGTLATKPLKTVESYWPYATTLFDYVRRAMPMNAPGSLSDEEVYAVSAYVLNRAHIVADTAVMDAHTLKQVRMPNRLGFVPDWKPGHL